MKIVFSILVGLTLGIGLYTFLYAKGYSYLSNNPEACANCHIMQNYYDGWVKSTHHVVATCNDCHTPKNIFGKYTTKANNGFWHSFYFTTGAFKEPIEIKSGNKKIVENNCRRCHQETVLAMDGFHPAAEKRACVSCHSMVGHP